MRDYAEVSSVAAGLKIGMRKRADRIVMLSNNIALVESRMAKMGKERLETMRQEVETLVKRQDKEAIEYSVLRWVLGVTPEFNADEIELAR